MLLLLLPAACEVLASSSACGSWFQTRSGIERPSLMSATIISISSSRGLRSSTSDLPNTNHPLSVTRASRRSWKRVVVGIFLFDVSPVLQRTYSWTMIAPFASRPVATMSRWEGAVSNGRKQVSHGSSRHAIRPLMDAPMIAGPVSSGSGSPLVDAAAEVPGTGAAPLVLLELAAWAECPVPGVAAAAWSWGWAEAVAVRSSAAVPPLTERRSPPVGSSAAADISKKKKKK